MRPLILPGRIRRRTATVLAAVSVAAVASAAWAASAGAAGPTAPGRPQIVELSSNGSPVITRWAPPASDGGSPITSYVVTITVGTSETVAGSCTTTPPTVQCSVGGLAVGVAYSVFVVATNAVGTSIPAIGGIFVSGVTVQGPITVLPNDTLRGVMTDLAAVIPQMRIVAVDPATRTWTVPGCSDLQGQPRDDAQAASMLAGDAYIDVDGTTRGPLVPACRPDAVTVYEFSP